MKIIRIGLDLAKNVFEVFAVNREEKPVIRKTLKRNKVLTFFAQQVPCVVAMESCGGAHYWARELQKLGHEVRMMAPQFVAPYRKSDKNDRNDAEAICEAAGRPNMRFVPIKNDIRWGSEWKTIETNMMKWAEFVKYKSLGPTLQVMNILDYDNIVDWAKKHDFEIFDNMLYNPPYFNLQNAPDSLKSQAQNFREWIDKPADEQHQENFRKVVKTFDKLRNCDIHDYIPEVARAYGIN